MSLSSFCYTGTVLYQLGYWKLTRRRHSNLVIYLQSTFLFIWLSIILTQGQIRVNQKRDFGRAWLFWKLAFKTLSLLLFQPVAQIVNTQFSQPIGTFIGLHMCTNSSWLADYWPVLSRHRWIDKGIEMSFISSIFVFNATFIFCFLILFFPFFGASYVNSSSRKLNCLLSVLLRWPDD